jgi:hypothetical protein
MPKYEIPVNISRSKRVIITVQANDLGSANKLAIAEARILGYPEATLFLEPEPDVTIVQPPSSKMTVSHFWSEQDRLDSALKTGQLSPAQALAFATILGWQWHRDHGSSLPARPKDSKPERWGIFLINGCSVHPRSADYPRDYTEQEAQERVAKGPHLYEMRKLSD